MFEAPQIVCFRLLRSTDNMELGRCSSSVGQLLSSRTPVRVVCCVLCVISCVYVCVCVLCLSRLIIVCCVAICYLPHPLLPQTTLVFVSSHESPMDHVSITVRARMVSKAL